MGEPEKKERVALFGGTFDPIHEGHIAIARHAMEALPLDRVIFLPCRQSPHKTTRAGAPDEARLEMLRLATEDLSWAEVSDWELSQPIPSFSWRTAEAFQECLDCGQLSWLMGVDQWETLPSWSRFSYFSHLVDFIVHARDGEGGRELRHPGARVSFVSGDHPASSSEIRSQLAKGVEVTADWLNPKVAALVAQRNLYLDEGLPESF